MKNLFSKKSLAVLYCIVAFSWFAHANTNPKFSSDGQLKIIQFTDIHWESGSYGHELITLSMEMILDREKPDLVVLTGDIVTHGDPFKGWIEVTKPMVDREIHWITTLGNHDSEDEIPRSTIYDSIHNIPFNISPEPEQIAQGIYDFSLPLKGSNGKNSAILYFFDSHSYTKPNMPGYYDWIKLNQVQWYKNESAKYKEENNNKPLPALAFFHIPLPEYKEVMAKVSTIGNKLEEVCSPEVNSGLFSAMVEMQDVMGMFVGHDHMNDFIGEHHNIALGYGRCSGMNSYGHLKTGARVIELVQDRFQFNSWIATPSRTEFIYHYPGGQQTQHHPEDLLQAIKTNRELKQGVAFRYFEGNINSVNQLSQLKEKKSGIVQNFDISSALQKDHFGFIFNAYIKVPENGLYSFYIYSDDGARLLIGDQLLIDNDGSHSPQLRKKEIGLAKGYHKLELLYFEDTNGSVLETGIKSLFMREGKIPDEMLFY
jgi:hypothetical protein